MLLQKLLVGGGAPHTASFYSAKVCYSSMWRAFFSRPLATTFFKVSTQQDQDVGLQEQRKNLCDN